jgi:hypothetical protein
MKGKFKMKIQVFWGVAQCWLTVKRRFGGGRLAMSWESSSPKRFWIVPTIFSKVFLSVQPCSSCFIRTQESEPSMEKSEN